MLRYSVILAALATALLAEPKIPAELEGVGVEEKLGVQVNERLEFVAENGRPVQLGRYLHQGRPVILNFVYYSCPMLCTLVLNGLTSSLREIPWTPGNEYEVVTISIDPREMYSLAASKKAAYLESFGRPAPGWHFLADLDDSAKKLASQVGFNYRWDEKLQQFAHSAALVLLTPDGKVARYLYGIQYKPFDLRLGLTEASQGRTGSTTDKLLLYCYQYDPNSRGYTMFAMNVMRGGGVLTVLILGFTITKLIRKERTAA